MKYILFFTLTFFTTFTHAQSRILVDGHFSDWDEKPVLYNDASGDGSFSGIDFGQLQIANDEDYIFFKIEVGDEINLQNENDISIYLDMDDNPATGFAINDIGADLIYFFGNRYGLYYATTSPTTIFHRDINLISAPTVTSDRFEIAIKRDISLSGRAPFSSENIKVVFKDETTNGDILPSESGGIEYTFVNENLDPLPSFSIPPTQESDLRIISYNTLFDGLFDQSRIPAFRRIFQATQPDIIGFQEIYDRSSAQVANQIESFIPSAEGQEWYHAKEGPDCHAISRYPILGSALIAGYNSSSGNGAFLIDIPNLEEHMLFIVAHPPCCSNNAGRQSEVDQIMEFIREAKNGNGPLPLEADAPIVIVGDMNFVGYHRQLETFLTGDISNESAFGADFTPDWDGSDFIDSAPHTTGVPFSYTWYDEGSSFSPGRLDYILYSGSNLLLKNNYALFTPSLSQSTLDDSNLFSDDAVTASDHLPVIADFQLKNITSNAEISTEKKPQTISIAPNPSNTQSSFSFFMPKKSEVQIQLLDEKGKLVRVLQKKTISAGMHHFDIDTSVLAAGVYFVRVESAEYSGTERLVVVK